MTWKSLTLHDLKGQYCNRNCIACSAFFLARRFYCEKNLRNLRPIFPLLNYDCSYLYRLTRWPRATSVVLTLIVAFKSSVPLTWRAWNYVTSKKSLSLRDWKSCAGLRRRRYSRLSLASVGLLVCSFLRDSHSFMYT